MNVGVMRPKRRVWPQILAGWLLGVSALTVLACVSMRNDYHPTPSVWEGNVWSNQGLDLSYSLPDGWVRLEGMEVAVEDEDGTLLYVRRLSDSLDVWVSILKTDYRPDAKLEADAFISSATVELGWKMELLEQKTIAGKVYECINIVKPGKPGEQYFLIRADGAYLITLAANGTAKTDLLPALERFESCQS